MKRELTINKGWYFSVGKRFGWDNEHSTEGVGIERRYFDCSELLVTVEDIQYRVNPEEALEHIRKYKAHEVLAGNKIGYIPRSLMQKV